MESRVRHDVRHPIATISMIVSTVSEFGDAIDAESLDEYRSRVGSELKSLASLLAEHGVDLEIDELAKAAEAFIADLADARAADSVAEECHRLLEELKKR